MAERLFCVYIITNARHTVLYTGVTSDLPKRIWQHREKTVDGFSKRYNVTKLVYYETCPDAMGAITREKQLKGGTRGKKMALVNGMNPQWRDLSDDFLDSRDRHVQPGSR